MCPTPAALETSLPAPSGTTCATQAPPVAPPPPATRSAALTSALPAPASWPPLSTARRPAVSPSGPRLCCPVPARCPATTRGPPRSPVPAGQLTQGLWALCPARTAPEPWILPGLWFQWLQTPELWSLGFPYLGLWTKILPPKLSLFLANLWIWLLDINL